MAISLVTLFGGIIRRTLSAASLSSQTIAIDDETTIHFWSPKPTTTSSSTAKPPLLLIHGFGPHGVWQWQQQINFFAKSYSLYIPNLVFFGGSYSTSSERSEIFQARAMGKLMEKVGVEKYYVVGTSYGGFVAFRMAEMWQDRVMKVVIANSAVNGLLSDSMELVKRGKVEKIEDLIMPEKASELRKLMNLSVFRRAYVPDFILNDFINRLYSKNRKEKLELLRGLTIGWDDIMKASPLQQEVLIVWGEHDKIFLLDLAMELKKVLGKNVKLKVIKNASHIPQVENAWKFNNIIDTFLRDSPDQGLSLMSKL
ncbi:hypothetical protein DCAR_0104721 [Daucus carota subsp. sativus]|uniref:AB hydrolase-1 domain-containing protein n=1 Tax=Daucus carota subsp. sativus TaxID=79200 RepID=A0A166J1N5_DAUCS|nr:PREDICTED: lipase 1 [Daucus carota subsp. sativus]WOG85531.1 hypothetical protein DCAR_0104721 [Daucus carota subsp. sativus]